MAEFPNLGKRCHMTNCQQLDFLPFECTYCHSIFCTSHRSVDAHNCKEAANAQKVVDARMVDISDIAAGPVCDHAECGNSTATVKASCDQCKRIFCLQHRHPFDHDCINASDTSSTSESIHQPSKAVQSVEEAKKSLKASVSNVDVNAKQQKPISAKNAATAAKIALMKLKQTAVGDQGKVPEEEKIYLRLRLPTGFSWKNSNEIPVFFSKTWTVGKCIIVASTLAGIPNESKMEKKRLRMILQNEHVCEMDEKMSKLEENGDLINGGSASLIYM